MSRLGVFLVFLISSEYIHLVSSRVKPVKLSQQKGGDVRGQRPRKTQLIKSHGMYKTFNLQTDFRPWEQREGPFYIVPYTITGQYAKEEMNYIETAMAHIQNNTCIQFREWRGEKNFLKIEDKPEGCFTEVNKTTPMILNLEKTHQTEEGEETCMTVDIVLHELLHAVGLEHEHQRPDRDEHVKLVEKNIDPNETYQYKKLKPQKIPTFGLPYDYNSIMHYGKTAFGIDKEAITIKTIDPQFQDVIGNASDGTSMDYLKVCKIYGCETCHGKVDHYEYEARMKRKETPKLTFSLDGCEDKEGQKQCEQLLLNRQLNCTKGKADGPCGCTCTAYYENYDKMSFYLLRIRKHRAEYTQTPDCEDSDPWRCEVQLAYQKMDCNEDTEAASCCVTCSSYRKYMRSD